MSVVVRKATLDDLPRILALYAQLNLPGTPPEPVPHVDSSPYAETLAAIIARADLWLLVAEVDGTVAGTLQLTIVPNLSHSAAPWANIENMVVDEKARGQGVGAALLEEAASRAEAAGCYKISLTSRNERADAHRFYRANGYEPRHQGFSRYFFGLRGRD